MMTIDDVYELTNLIDNCNYGKETISNKCIITPKSLHTLLWSKFNQLRTAINKDVLIENWKYKKEFEIVEKPNANNFVNVEDVEQQMLVHFWLSIYH
jgi:hypothetical protein